MTTSPENLGITINTRRIIKTLISIVGPTAIGKTALAIQLAEHFRTEIISADSRQFYKEMTIGTAKPSAEDLLRVPHHFINNLNIYDEYSAGDFEKEVLELLNRLFVNTDLVIMAGGSGLFVNAVCSGLDILPKPTEGIREKLNNLYKEKGLAHIQQLLMESDPKYYHQVDLSNPQRIIRSLEVFQSTGIPFSDYRKQQTKPRDFNIVSIGLEMPRPALYERINQRVDNMFADGLIDEVKQLIDYRDLPPLLTVGYRELFDYLDGLYSLETAGEKIKQHTRQYAKRQMTWFKRNETTMWFHPHQANDIIKHLESVHL
nr:tRNA (adenosine(37)-N6)-dimethylallyltransferase MiaA [Olivibacter sitiensis]